MRQVATCIALLALLGTPSGTRAQSFSCGFGEQPACLDYSDTVCSSQGKCVDRAAACFDTYQCDYEGFACKSDVTDCSNAYDELLGKHNELVDDYNELLSTAKELSERTENLESQLEETQDELGALESCVMTALDVQDARSCP